MFFLIKPHIITYIIIYNNIIIIKNAESLLPQNHSELLQSVLEGVSHFAGVHFNDYSLLSKFQGPKAKGKSEMKCYWVLVEGLKIRVKTS